MIKDVMVRLDGTAADEVRLSAANDIAEYFESHIIGLFLNVLPLVAPIEGVSGPGAPAGSTITSTWTPPTSFCRGAAITWSSTRPPTAPAPR